MSIRRRNNVRVTGAATGRPVVLVHGFGCDQNMWRLVEPLLAEDHPLVLFDYVGAGRSDLSAWQEDRYSSLDGYARDLVEVCEDLDLRDAVVVGHSVSAMTGVLAAAAAPERIGALVMVCPSPRYIDEDGYRGGFSAEDIDELLESLESNYLGWSATMAPVIMGNPDRPELGEELTNSFCATDPDIARVFARTTFLSDSRKGPRDRDRPHPDPGVRAGRHRASRGRRVRPRRRGGQRTAHPRRRGPLPAAQRPRGHRLGDPRLLVLRSPLSPGAADDPGVETPSTRPAFSSLLEDSAEDLYESAPCGYLSTLMDGTIAKINATLLGWLGLSREEVVGRKRFSDLLTVGGRLYHETHFAPPCCACRATSAEWRWRCAPPRDPGCRCWSPPPSSAAPTVSRS